MDSAPSSSKQDELLLCFDCILKNEYDASQFFRIEAQSPCPSCNAKVMGLFTKTLITELVPEARRDGRTFLVTRNGLLAFKQHFGTEKSSGGPPHQQIANALGLRSGDILAGGAGNLLSDSKGSDGDVQVSWTSGTGNLGLGAKAHVNHLFTDEAVKREARALPREKLEVASSEIANYIHVKWAESVDDLQLVDLSPGAVKEIRAAVESKLKWTTEAELNPYWDVVVRLHAGVETLEFPLPEVVFNHQVCTAKMLEEIASSMPENCRLKAFDLTNFQELLTSVDGGRAIGKFLAKCTRLEELSVTGNYLEPEALTQMAMEMPNNHTLKDFRFYVGANWLSTQDGGCAMGKFLAKCTGLEKLRLWDYLSPEALMQMAMEMPESNTLKDVTYLNTCMTSNLMSTQDGGRAMGKLLAKCTRLETLSLSAIFTPEALTQTEMELSENNTIKHIDVRASDGHYVPLMETQDGGRAMGKLLAKCRGLETLRLDVTSISPEALTQTAMEMSENNTLKDIDFKVKYSFINLRRQDGGRALVKFLAKCTGLETIRIDEGSYTPEALTQIAMEMSETTP